MVSKTSSMVPTQHQHPLQPFQSLEVTWTRLGRPRNNGVQQFIASQNRVLGRDLQGPSSSSLLAKGRDTSHQVRLLKALPRLAQLQQGWELPYARTLFSTMWVRELKTPCRT